MSDTDKQGGEAAPRPKKKWKRVLLAIVLAPFVAAALYTWAALSFTYSNGERAGYLQKFSQKGWLCKTWEGEIAMASIPGAMPEIFRFTVRNDSVAMLLNGLSGQRVALYYEQHRGVPTTCFGETEYFVKGVQPIKQP